MRYFLGFSTKTEKTKKYVIDDNGLTKVELIRHQFKVNISFFSFYRIKRLIDYVYTLLREYNGYDAVDFLKMTSCTHAIKKCL